MKRAREKGMKMTLADVDDDVVGDRRKKQLTLTLSPFRNVPKGLPIPASLSLSHTFFREPPAHGIYFSRSQFRDVDAKASGCW